MQFGMGMYSLNWWKKFSTLGFGCLVAQTNACCV